jgi:hypothetical protein
LSSKENKRFLLNFDALSLSLFLDFFPARQVPEKTFNPTRTLKMPSERDNEIFYEIQGIRGFFDVEKTRLKPKNPDIH